MKRSLLLLLFFIGICSATLAQVNSSRVCWNDEKDKSISLQFDNDTYYYTDYYYTNGLEVELILPDITQSPTSAVFPKITDNQKLISGVGLAHRLYTPKNIRDTLIQFNDRPFAATLEINHFMFSKNQITGSSFSGQLQLGLMGPAAGGAQFHQLIHDWIQSPDPNGWDYQIANDIILNYNFQMYHPFIYTPSVSFGISGKIRAGTLFDDLGIGLHFATGKKQLKASSTSNFKKPQIFFTTDLDYKLVVYNATLQGGLFSTNDPYVMSFSSITPYVISAHARLGILWYGISLSYAHNYISKEFDAGESHNYGSFTLKIGF